MTRLEGLTRPTPPGAEDRRRPPLRDDGQAATGQMIPGAAVLVSHQPAYLPWPGYFSRLLDVSRFVVLDHVDFTRGWQQRNYVRDIHHPGHHPGRHPVTTGGHAGGASSDVGRRWLTVPVAGRGYRQAITEVRIAGDRWRERHWGILEQTYRHAAYWPHWEQRLRAIYTRPWRRLAELNVALIRLLLDGFGIQLELSTSSELAPPGRKTEMLINLCRAVGATTLRVGDGATGYLDAPLLAHAGIGVQVATYTTVPYAQDALPFVPGLSALDLLLNQGPNARAILTQGAGLRTWRHPGTPQ